MIGARRVHHHSIWSSTPMQDHDPERASMSSAEPSRNRIVVGVDGSPSSFAGLDWAGHQADLTGSVFHLVTAWNWPAAYGTAFVFTDDFSRHE